MKDRVFMDTNVLINAGRFNGINYCRLTNKSQEWKGKDHDR
jgi:hypothetical protein